MSKYLNQLIEELEKLPGVGPKTAQRLALHIMKQQHKTVEALASALIDATTKTKQCKWCCDFADTDTCEICQYGQQAKRDTSVVCVVAEHKDVVAIESSRDYKGTYHVLGGMIDPMNGIGPEHLKIKELLARIGASLNTETPITEVIAALDGSVSGEATTLYITKLLKACGVKGTRISFGLSVGTGLEFADPFSISKAISGRTSL